MSPNAEVYEVFDRFRVPMKFREDNQLVQTAWNLVRVAGSEAEDAGFAGSERLQASELGSGEATVENRVVVREIFGNQLRYRLACLQDQTPRRRLR